MLPTALAFERGGEANAPLARAILGGLLAAGPATLFVLPALYSLLVRDWPGQGALSVANSDSISAFGTSLKAGNVFIAETVG